MLRVELSWPGPEDLDIYLYYNTMDILSRTLYEDREYSPTYNPEILEYVNYYTDLYYVRVDLYTTVPTAYQIDIYVNGVLQHTYYDTVISVQTGLTTQQFTIDGVCEIRVKYDGPICGVYLFEPGVDVLTGYAVAADLSNTNPKYITQVLTVPGLWTVAVQHQIMSTYGQIPFKIVIETNQGAN